MPESPTDPPRRLRRRSREPVECPCCHARVRFAWTCRCGFQICQICMQDNLWGMTCNHINWHCPDCGRSNGFGNQ